MTVSSHRNLLILLVACGPKAVEPVKPPPPVRPVTPETVCARFDTLRGEHCGTFDNMTVTSAQCPEVFQMAFADPTSKDGRVLGAMGKCMVDHPTCQGVTLCIAAIQYEDPHDLRACADPNDSRAVGVTPGAFQARNGAAVSRLPDVKSSKTTPIEACGISGGLEWLVASTCADGSHPVKSSAEAEAARVQNVGPGGSCGSIIDLYRLTCPEAVYDVFVDGYVCPLP